MLQSVLRPFAHVAETSAVTDWEAAAAAAPDAPRPLCGVVFTVADTVQCAGMPTGYGAPEMLPEGVGAAGRDEAPVVSALRAAGAVVRGKSVVPPFGWNDYPVPPLLNPRCFSTPERHGAAVAVAAGLADAAVGTEPGGGITAAGARCGAAAWKATHGAVPTAGCFVNSPEVDAVGVVARTAADLSLIREVLCPPVPAVKATGRAARLLAPAPPPERGFLRFGVARQLGHASEDAAEELAIAADALGAAGPGIRVVEVSHPLFNEIIRVQGQYLHRMNFDIASAHDEFLGGYLETRECSYPSLAEAQSAGFRRRMYEEPYQASQFRKRWQYFVEHLVLRAWDLDVLVSPCASVPQVSMTKTRVKAGEDTLSILWAFSGHPVCAVPLLRPSSSGPFSAVQLVGRLHCDEQLLAAAQAAEAAVAAAAPPGCVALHSVDPLDLLQRGADAAQAVQRPAPPAQQQRQRSPAAGGGSYGGSQ
eukprot:TRINITY_DN23508_c0_g1_i2.p1 TRINITY_DN23508_c0_g1~~TRINITY_DN23508_c0_g1_i2.p1  ORF type:complete len:538 (+),score=117.10 TRINITY_DN23508_c0_g1_i2:186-1616(+)